MPASSHLQNDIKSKMDGFEGNPNDEWIINERAQRKLCAFIEQILAGACDCDAPGFEEEVRIGTDPFDKDTDDDMLCDGQEVTYFMNTKLELYEENVSEPIVFADTTERC
jgi:hypothetical protein